MDPVVVAKAFPNCTNRGWTKKNRWTYWFCAFYFSPHKLTSWRIFGRTVSAILTKCKYEKYNLPMCWTKKTHLMVPFLPFFAEVDILLCIFLCELISSIASWRIIKMVLPMGQLLGWDRMAPVPKSSCWNLENWFWGRNCGEKRDMNWTRYCRSLYNFVIVLVYS